MIGRAIRLLSMSNRLPTAHRISQDSAGINQFPERLGVLSAYLYVKVGWSGCLGIKKINTSACECPNHSGVRSCAKINACGSAGVKTPGADSGSNHFKRIKLVIAM